MIFNYYSIYALKCPIEPMPHFLGKNKWGIENAI
jgi:hypothetical protein